MAAVPTRVYPLSRSAGVPLAGVPGVPHIAHEVPSKAEAEALEASGAFTTDARHPDRLAGDDDEFVPGKRTVSPKRETPEPAAESAPSEPAPAGEES